MMVNNEGKWQQLFPLISLSRVTRAEREQTLAAYPSRLETPDWLSLRERW